MQKCRYKTAKTVEILPENSSWDYRNLAVFVNELKEFKYDPKNGSRIQFNPDNAQYFFSGSLINPTLNILYYQL